jgi:hypothetical protein
MTEIINGTESALCYSIVHEVCLGGRKSEPVCCNAVVRFVAGQRARLPDFLRPVLGLLTVLFSVQCAVCHGRLFHRLDHQVRWRHVAAWRQSKLGFRRDFVRFYESLVILAWNAGEP